MSGHMKWTDPRWPDIDWPQARAAAGAKAIRETRAWVKGYILALEDVIKDLEVQLLDFRGHEEGASVLETAQGKVQQSLTTARETLDQLNKIKEAPDASEQGQG